jgi:hypothetical protein
MLHLGKLRPYLQTLYSVGKACQGETLYLITNICILQLEKGLQTLGTETYIIKHYEFEMYRFHSKLMSYSISYKNAMLTNTLAYYGIHSLRIFDVIKV